MSSSIVPAFLHPCKLVLTILQLFAFLTHEDSKINIEIANASKALAEATKRDGSSMKTIAVLTMAFLPATFLAALFAIPSLGWNQPDKFTLYWACVIPITALTFALWAVLTKRQAILEFGKLVRRRRKLEREESGSQEISVWGRRGHY